jgi:tetratricopeptide (TPR) repeat protein
MKRIFIFILYALIAFTANAQSLSGDTVPDSNTVIKLNKLGFAIRFTNPATTVEYANKALALAKKLKYDAGIAESYRTLGIGEYYLNQTEQAMNSYLTSLDYFAKVKDLHGEAKVYNNIGCLYRDNDYDLALEFLQKSLVIARKLSSTELLAPVYLNIGTVYLRKQSFYQALNYYNKSTVMYSKLGDSVNMLQCLQNRGVIYYSIQQYDRAEALLLEAIKGAKQQDLNELVASINLTLSDIYRAQNKFDNAEKAVLEGEAYAKLVKDEKLQSDFTYTSYQLELKRKNYEKALSYLQGIYTQDSINYKKGTSTQINLIRLQVKQLARQKENEFLLERQGYDRVKFLGVALVAGLLLVLVGLLISNVKRKAKTNEQLTNLNAEVSRQKDNLDRINHHLEEIIDERTKDLQVKNKKLSEYSSYLSHQIRGPIATLKGLMNLEKEGLVDQQECIKMMNKCVSEIDDKIIEMSDMLHDPVKTSL